VSVVVPIIGGWTIRVVPGGSIWVDGGAMFGVVPFPLWSAIVPTDDHRRIELATNCLLLEGHGRRILVDTGCGTKMNAKQRQFCRISDGDPLLENLSRLGLEPSQIDTVILTHLHFDHAGGCTRSTPQGGLEPVFTAARHVVQRREWYDAVAQLPELVGAYHLDDLLPVEAAGLLELVDGDVDYLPGLRLELTGGHTRGHQIVRLHDASQQAIYLADLCPSAAHLPALWGMAYDQQPLEVRRRRPALLGQIADHGWWAIFEHDPVHTLVKLQRHPKREFALAASQPLE
jgi:glyoxylase-like metal-dependent hydrolase (beta-lactamase superfamily II)